MHPKQASKQAGGFSLGNGSLFIHLLLKENENENEKKNRNFLFIFTTNGIPLIQRTAAKKRTRVMRQKEM